MSDIKTANVTSYVLFKSADRMVETDDPANCKIHFDQTVASGSYRVMVTTIPNSIYTVDSRNNQIYFYENGTDKTATITTQNWAPTDLAVHLKTILDTASDIAVWTITFNTATNKFNFVSTTNVYFKWNINDNIDSAHKILGFNYVTTTASTNFDSTNVIDLAIKSLNCYIQPFSGTTFVDGQNHQGQIYCIFDQAFGNFNVTTHLDFKQTLHLHNSTKMFKFNIYDTDGRQVSLNGLNWEILVQRCS